MLIDCHTHAFLDEDLEVLRDRLTMLDQHLPDLSPHKWQIHGPGTIAGLTQAMEAAGADRWVLLPVASKKDRAADLNRWAAAAAAAEPRLIPFAMLHPLGPAAADVRLIQELGLKGVKLHPFLQRFSMNHPLTHDLLALLEGGGLPVLIDTLYVEGLVKAKPHMQWVVQMFKFKGCEPLEIARAATAHPTINFIAAHGGSLYGWEHLEPLYELDNVYFDLAYLRGLIAADPLMAIIRRKGPERVLYGTDAPWRDARACREWFEDLPLSTWEREQIAAGTLLGLLGG